MPWRNINNLPVQFTGTYSNLRLVKIEARLLRGEEIIHKKTLRIEAENKVKYAHETVQLARKHPNVE